MSDGAHRGYPITAWSTVNGLGTSTGEVMSRLRSGQAALSPPPLGTPFETVCGVVGPDLDPLPEALGRFDSRNNRFVQRALTEIRPSIEAAREHWGSDRVGICVGSSTAAMDEIESAYANHAETGSLPAGFEVFACGSFDGLIQTLRALTGLEGPAAIVSNACASSGKAFASAQRWINAGIVDAVLVGGADSLCQITLRGFRSLGLISSEPSRPFSRERRGINIGEGAAFALLERRGQGPRLLGTGESGDAHHMTTPDPEGRGAQRAMEAAIADAGVSASDIDYVNAHGTGTAFNDAMEARAIRATLGDRADPIVVSTKGYVGHTLGAAGAIEAVFVLETLQKGWIPASLGADPLDPEMGLNIPTARVDADVRIALSNSFAFGGSNVSLVFGAPE
ncbi:MAG: beta-ketoacyl-ACP synthase [Myxococcales bacterium]|nr:beta-ketoacyl-ACP synthase [Myxococcales bacterium]